MLAQLDFEEMSEFLLMMQDKEVGDSVVDYMKRKIPCMFDCASFAVHRH